MKKNLLIISGLLIAFSLSSLGISQLKNSEPAELNCTAPVEEEKPIGPFSENEFIYKVDNRFLATVTLEEIKNAKTIVDLLPEDAPQQLSDFKMVKIDSLPNKNNTALLGQNEFLNKRQKQLLNNLSVSSNFYLESYCKRNNYESGAQDNYNLVYYLSVVPETPAVYSHGLDSLTQYLSRKNAKHLPMVDWERLWPGRLAFTVSKTGEIERVYTETNTGQKAIDANVIELIKTLPGTWEPAKNKKGEPISQELILFYGMEGC